MRPYLLIALAVAVGALAYSTIARSQAESLEVGLSSGLPEDPVVVVEPREGLVFPGEEWDWAESLEALGWSAEKLATAEQCARRIGSAAVMIIDNGVAIAGWGDLGLNYHCHSMRKSLMSALIGIYVSEGAIDINATLADLDIDDITPLTDEEKQATVQELLQARSGIYIRAAGESEGMANSRPERGSHPHGTFWYYNNWDFNALGTIFDQETGEPSIYEAFDRKIAQAIGMQDFRPESLAYHFVDYTVHPYYGFDMSTRDLARFGLLFLRNGRWENEQVVPAAWVAESTASLSDRGAQNGYGYMWWTGTDVGFFSNVTVSEHSYYASGYGGHNVFVLPQRDLVVVHRANTFSNGRLVDDGKIGALLWMILDAAGETGIGEAPFIERASGSRLSGEDLRGTIPSSTLTALDGSGTPTVLCHQDGSLDVLAGDAPMFDGDWWIVGDRLCFDIPGLDTHSDCFHVVRDEDVLAIYDLDGIISIRFRMVDE